MKSNKSKLSVRLIVLGIVLAVLIAGGLLWWNDAIAPFDPDDKTPVVFVVSRGENGREVATRLSNERLIRSPIGFYILLKTLGIETSLQAGEFRLRRDMDAKTIAQELTHGTIDVWVTIVEGWRVEEVAVKIAKELDIPEKEFLKLGKEGYMFPDTYRFPMDATAGAVIFQFMDTFNTKVTDDIRNAVKTHHLMVDQMITLASIVEREGNSDEDRPMIAGILLNRLKNGWPLQVDATLQYILGYQIEEKTWWKKNLVEEDKSIVSPYNTYLNVGLPPGPICSPGLSAIRAVAYPKASDYMYYLHDTEGNIHYARTMEEHEDNIRNYLR